MNEKQYTNPSFAPKMTEEELSHQNNINKER